jgi:hypothetical protein
MHVILGQVYVRSLANDREPSQGRARGHDKRGTATMPAHSDVPLKDLDGGRMTGSRGDSLVSRDQRRL